MIIANVFLAIIANTCDFVILQTELHKKIIICGGGINDTTKQ